MSAHPLKPKERLQRPRQVMPERAPAERRGDFDEVNLGFEAQQAYDESLRCLECTRPACQRACPVGVQIPQVVALVLRGDLRGAAAKLREDNVLPAITGRVCPQEEQCEGGCVLGRRVSPLAIGHLERFLADYESRTGEVSLPPCAAPSGRRVAIVGSGPAGLAAAGDLARRGHAVTVLEALHELGGVLIYGIPEFRLPKHIVQQETEVLRRMGVVFETNVVVGKTVSVAELMGVEGFSAVLIATGAGLPRFLGVPNEHLNGVCSANEFLTRVNLMRAHRFPDYDEPLLPCRDREVAVVGGGNTALDAARTALRLGARQVWLVYRRSEKELPARAEELHHARDEGLRFLTLADPVAFEEGPPGWLAGVRLRRMQLGPPDASGRPRPEPIPGSEFSVPVELAIVAVGTHANPLVGAATPGLALDKRGYIAADPETLATSLPGVFAAGDIVTGAATVIAAMGAGRRAAAAIDAYLTGAPR